MATTEKFDNKRVRLWRGIGKKTRAENIAVKFHKDKAKDEIEEIYMAIHSLLVSRYGEGILS